MGIFDKLFKSKEEKAFEKALEERNYKRAVEIGKEYKIDEEKMRSAERKLAISEAIAHYNQDDESRELIDNALKAVKDIRVVKNISKKDERLLRYIAFAQSQSGNIMQAIEIAQGIKDKDVSSRSLIYIAARQKDNLSEAIEILRKMPYKGLLYEQLRDISVAQALSGNTEKAIETAQNIPNGEAPRRILYFIESAKSRSGDLQQATETAQKMGDTYTLTSIAFTHALSGNIKQAIETVKILDPIVSSHFLSIFARGFVWLGDVEQAVEIAQKIPDQFFRSFTLGDIAMIHSNSYDDAIKIVQEIPDAGFRSLVLLDITVKRLFLGEVKQVIRAVQEIEDKDFRSEVLGIITESIEALIEAQASIE